MTMPKSLKVLFSNKNYLYEATSNLSDKTYDLHVFVMFVAVDTKTIFTMCHVVMLSLLVGSV